MNTEQNQPKFKIGDVVEIIGYGSLIWVPKSERPKFNALEIIQETETLLVIDISPNEVGEKGVVQKITVTQGRVEYSLAKSGKQAWFNEGQLKLIE